MIPRIIHQIWGMRDGGEMPERFRESQASWQRQHPDWTYMLWGPEAVDRLIDEHYPHVRTLYEGYPEWIQRADASRYLILHHHGGIYSDLDIICRRPWDDLRAHGTILPRTAPIGVSNDLMAGEQGSAFFAEVIAALNPALRRWGHWYVPRHFRILMTTGSLFLTRTYRHSARSETVYILAPELYGNGGPEHSANSYVAHVAGNSWTSWDSEIFIFIHGHWRWIAGAAAAALAIIALK